MADNNIILQEGQEPFRVAEAAAEIRQIEDPQLLFFEDIDDEIFFGPEGEDRFQMLEGLRGPYFTPSVNEDGVISWTNTGGLQNPPAVNIKGPPGQGLAIGGIVESTSDLPESDTSGKTWLVGTEPPYEGYVYVDGAWADIGELLIGPTGPQGQTGATPDLQIGTVSTLSPGSAATASITGTPEEPILNLGIPEGEQGEVGATPDLQIGTVSTLPAGSAATAAISGTPEEPILNLGIPEGEQGVIGPTPEFSIGTVSTLPPATPASASITGTAAAPVLNLGIPKGDDYTLTAQDKADIASEVAQLLPVLDVVSEEFDTNTSLGTIFASAANRMTGWAEWRAGIMSMYIRLNSSTPLSSGSPYGVLKSWARPLKNYIVTPIFASSSPFAPIGSLWIYGDGTIEAYYSGGTPAYVFVTYTLKS